MAGGLCCIAGGVQEHPASCSLDKCKATGSESRQPSQGWPSKSLEGRPGYVAATLIRSGKDSTVLSQALNAYAMLPAVATLAVAFLTR